MPQRSTLTEKENLHPRNLHRGRYDFKQLCESSADLREYVSVNPHGNESIDFSNPEAVRALNKALLKQFYKIGNWELPPRYLCPPTPGRADYIHYIADLLNETQPGTTGSDIKVLDIGVGASCIYPIIGNAIYGWLFVGSDIDPDALRSARQIVASNKSLKDNIELRLQPSQNDLFNNIIKPGEVFDVTICNPPFHSSSQEA